MIWDQWHEFLIKLYRDMYYGYYLAQIGAETVEKDSTAYFKGQ
jgi:hypothetical protein